MNENETPESAPRGETERTPTEAAAEARPGGAVEPVEEAITAEIVEDAAVAPATPAQPEPATAPMSAPQAATPRYGEAAQPGAAFGAPAPTDPQPSQPQTPAGATGPRRRTWIPALAAGGVLGLVLGAGAGAGAGYLVAHGGNASATPNGAATGATTITVNNPNDVTQISAVAATAMASVVTISATGSSSSGTGSGVVLDDQGYIVTNNHVVTVDGYEAHPDIKVTTSAGKVYTATVVGTDPTMDLAVIKVTDAEGLVPIDFADSSKLNVGSTTIAIGAPLGLSGTVTSGIVSALNRSIEVASSAVPDDSADSGSGSGSGSGGGFNFWGFGQDQGQSGSQTQTQSSGSIQLPVIQTDTAINPGNSGGALLDANGDLIGINVAIATADSSSSSSSGQSGSIGVGFAIPANVVKRITDEIIQSGSATHGLLGASVADVADDPAQKDADVVGASIVEVVAGGAAEQAGLKAGDIITTIDGVPVTGKTDITAQVRSHASGSTVTIGYDRGGSAYTTQATLGDLGQ